MKFIRFAANKSYGDSGMPVPAKKTIPEWFKEAESSYLMPDGNVGAGLKTCMPYTDILMSGYMLTFPADVHVSSENGELKITWGDTPAGDFIKQRPAALGATMPRPYGFLPNHLVFSGRWGWKTPRGYSTLVTHPFNRVDLPFHTISAVVDSDEFHASGNIPFFIRADFEGTIKAGTPFAQLLPVKRDAWKLIANDQGIIDKTELHGEIVRNEETPYKKIAWHRKKYD